MKTKRLLAWLLALMLLVSFFPGRASAATSDPPPGTLPDQPSAPPSEPADSGHTHDYSYWIVMEEPTCTSYGTRYRICQTCGERQWDYPDALPHPFGDWELLVPATDHSAGTARRVCTVCGYEEIETFAPEGTILPGTQGEIVERLQEALAELGYLSHRYVDGDYGAKTEEAVKKLQEDKGLEPDGVAWPQTLLCLMHEYGPWTVTVMPTHKAVGKMERTCRLCGHTESADLGLFLEAGETGDAVTALQEALVALGYELEVTGVYDRPTRRAVEQYQRDQGTTVDGRTTPELWLGLFPLPEPDPGFEDLPLQPEDEDEPEDDGGDDLPEDDLSGGETSPAFAVLPDVDLPEPEHKAHLEIVLDNAPADGEAYKSGETIRYSYKLFNDCDIPITKVNGYTIDYVKLKYVHTDSIIYGGTGRFDDNGKSCHPHTTLTWTDKVYHVGDAAETMGEVTLAAVAFVSYEDGYSDALPATITVKVGDEKPLLDGVRLEYQWLTSPKNGVYYVPGEPMHYQVVLVNESPVDLWARVYPAWEGNFDSLNIDFYNGLIPVDHTYEAYAGEVAAGKSRICYEKSFSCPEVDELTNEGWVACATVDFLDGWQKGFSKPLVASTSALEGPMVAAPQLRLVPGNQPENNEYFWKDSTVGYEVFLDNAGDYCLYGGKGAVTLPDGSTKDFEFGGEVSPGASLKVADGVYTFTEGDEAAGSVSITAEADCRYFDAAWNEFHVPASGSLDLPTGVKPDAAVNVTVTSEPGNTFFYEEGETVTYSIRVSNTAGKESIRKATLYAEFAPGQFENLGDLGEIAPEGSSEAVSYSRTVTADEAAAGALSFTAKATCEFTDLTRVEPEASVSVDTGAPALKVDLVTSSAANSDGFYVRDDEIVYQITVSNIGNVSIPTVQVYLTDPAGTVLLGTLGDFAAGASQGYTHSYYVSGPDVAAGSVKCSVEAQGTIFGEPSVVAEAKMETSTGMYPADLGLSKTVTSSPENGSFYQEGELIAYQITVTNNGVEPLVSVTLTDEDPAGSVALDTLIAFQPGDSFSYSHSHSVTAEEAAAGSVTNTVTADCVLPDDSGMSLSASVSSDTGVAAGDCCVRTELGETDGVMQYSIAFCTEHQAVADEAAARVSGADGAHLAEAWQEVCELWLHAMNEQYDALAAAADEEGAAFLAGEREAFAAWTEEKTAALMAETPEDPVAPLMALTGILREHTADLCELLHTSPADGIAEGLLTAAGYLEGYDPAAALAEPEAEPLNENDGLTGTWYLSQLIMDGAPVNPVDAGMELSVELNADGSASMISNGQAASGVWTLEGEVLTITANDSPAAFSVTEQGLAIEQSGVGMLLTREPPAPGYVPAAPVSAESLADFNGSWEGVYVNVFGVTAAMSQVQDLETLLGLPSPYLEIQDGEIRFQGSDDSKTFQFADGCLSWQGEWDWQTEAFRLLENGDLVYELGDNAVYFTRGE